MAPSEECNRPIGILFVCLGNICRSPMAEAVFSHIVAKRGLASHFHIDSAGTAGYHVGEQPDRRTVATCKKNHVAISHRGQLLVQKHFDQFDYILCMDRENLSNSTRVKPRSPCRAKLELFGSYSEDAGDLIVEDPYYGGLEGFEEMYERIVRCSEGLLERLIREKGIQTKTL
ncbi:Low molecular weight phosphotyrosine protein phosphatase [Coemansia sp. RSA 2675]|nr:Low molecular weight phosphotyrosine protein phosphatase [Coemansia sp. RSA 2675]